MDTYFTIGELAKLSNISKQTLIFYDKADVFKPHHTDPNNKYRYYSADQIEILDSLLILKEIGLSLDEIKAFMQSRNTHNAVTLLKKQQEDISNTIANLQRISHKLARKIDILEDFYHHPHNKITYKTLPLQYLALEPVQSPNGLLEVDLALKSLLHTAAQKKYPHFYQIGDMVAYTDIEKGLYTHFSYAFLPLETPFEKAYLHEKPQGLYASSYHRGEYHTIQQTYQKLIADITKHKLRPIGYSYEFCILDSLTSKTDSEYITEIQIRVEETVQR